MAEVIAGIGFAFQAYGAIVELYKVLSKAQGLEKEAPILLWKLRMQQVRFEVFGRHWRLDKPGFNAFVEEEGLLDIINVTLSSIQQMFKDGSRMDKLYGVQIPNDGGGNSGGAAALIASDPAANLDNVNTNRKDANEATTINKKVNLVGRFRWALRDKAKFEKLILDLKEYNDGLHAFLRLREASILENLAQSMLLHGVTDLQSSQSLLQASQENAAAAVSAPTTQLHLQSQQKVYNKLQKSIETKSFLLLQGRNAVSNGYTGRPTMLIDQRSVRYAPMNSPSDVRLLAELDTQDLALEQETDTKLMSAIIDWKDTDVNDSLKGKITQRLNGLAELLSTKVSKPDDLRVLKCIGFFEDIYVRRHGILHQIPVGAEARPPITLHDLMARQNGDVPDLNERFSLAQALTTSILRLHDCGWLHMSFRSSNVVFFSRSSCNQSRGTSLSTPSRSIDLSQPYLIGFSYSKPTSLEELTLEHSRSTLEHSLYRDPKLVMQADSSTTDFAAFRVRQQMRHDYYSLGIVLLEIGLWDQVSTYWKSKYSRQSFLEKLLTAYVPKLGPKMGATYRDVVYTLLTGSNALIDEEGDTSGQEVLHLTDQSDTMSNLPNWDIANRLMRCSA